ncbi:hypothetical protein [Streptomyces sp. NPDC048496]|uniref:hypothetical protein n=1 Tax=Streptomyces sp. NPDC048496 TaxID=3365558 RepID=UPI00371B7CFC
MHLAGRGVDGGGVAGRAHWFGAAADVIDLPLCAVEAWVVDEGWAETVIFARLFR